MIEINYYIFKFLNIFQTCFGYTFVKEVIAQLTKIVWYSIWMKVPKTKADLSISKVLYYILSFKIAPDYCKLLTAVYDHLRLFKQNGQSYQNLIIHREKVWTLLKATVDFNC